MNTLTRKQVEDRHLAECLFRLRNVPEFEPLRRWLREEQLAQGDRLVAANDDRECHQAQGAARWLRRFTEMIEQAPRLLEQERR